ncbi:hypothetical protein QOZ80_4AG0305690 [Eleusine coracana subsp. coracana]|nr:hypothetical protein QOZ80_4AG0305690 [Eleusine coracana subsp. coracana]
MEKAAGEDEVVEDREKAAPSAGAPATKKRKRAAAARVEASGAVICDDILSNILARLPARSAVASMALSKHHHALICSPEFRTLHCRLGAPLPRPHIAFVSTAAIRRRLEHNPVSGYYGFHVAGAAATTSSNEPMRALTGGRYRDTKFVNTCNGVVLLAGKRFSDQCRCILWNPAVADEPKAVTLPDSSEKENFLVLALGYGRRSDTYKILLCRKEDTRRSHWPGGGMCCGYGKCLVKYRLLSYDLGNGKTEPLSTVMTMALKEETKVRSLYMDGTIYLLLEKSAILAFDVDDETVTTIDLPCKWHYEPDRAWEVAPKLFEVSGRPCMVAKHEGRWALWMLTVDHQLEQRRVIVDGIDRVHRLLHTSPLAGVWDCRDMLVLLFENFRLCLYHFPTAKMFVTILPYDLVPKGVRLCALFRLHSDARVAKEHHW